MGVDGIVRPRIVSIHAPRVGSDDDGSCGHETPNSFNPRSPRGERPSPACELTEDEPVSIHAPRVGSDDTSNEGHQTDKKFQSTLPAWGATRVSAVGQTAARWFQSTLPAWGATCPPTALSARMRVSIHAPRVGSDAEGWGALSAAFVFQSTLPAWGATSNGTSWQPFGGLFQSTLPAWGATADEVNRSFASGKYDTVANPSRQCLSSRTRAYVN